MDGLIDLHIHTCASDGTYRPQELLEEVQSKGLSCFAVTDHDEIHNVEEVGRLAQQHGIDFLHGVEISAVYKNHTYHITAYGCDFHHPLLADILHHNSAVWHNIDLRRIRYVSGVDARANMEEFAQYDYELGRGGWHSLNYMLDKGIIKSLEEYFIYPFPGTYPPSFASLTDVTKAVHAAGGIAFLAHPAHYSKQASFFDYEYLDALFSCGIDGLECYTTYNASEEEGRYYAAYARAHGLPISGGSDAHGSFIPTRAIGQPAVHIEMIGDWYKKYLI